MTFSKISKQAAVRREASNVLGFSGFLLLLAAVVLLWSAPASAQLAGKGEIKGQITDSSGAVIPGATVTATSTTQGTKFARTTSNSGDFDISPLDADIYTVTVACKGFQTLTQENVHVNALEVADIKLTLTVGSEAQTVDVSTAPPQLETSNAMLGATMENDMYSALPIEMGAYGQPDQRRATDFAALLPGVQVNETNGNATTNTGVVNGSGSRGAASVVYIDGVPFTNAAGEGDPRFVWTAISVDAVNQFQVETSGYSALYEGQGMENFTVKQGGNKYHGAVYEFFRNTALDSWGFFKATNPVTGQLQKPVEHQNEYGILLSGPLVPIGGLRDKLFFFGNYNGFRYSHSSPQVITFPNAAEQAGNFQGIQPIYDPSTQTACTANSTNGQCRYRYGYVYGGTKGPGGNPVLGPGGNAAVDMIPSSEFSAVALAMQSTIPALINQNPTNNYVAQNYSALSNWSTTERIDYAISQKDTLSVIGAVGRQASSVPVGQTTTGRNTGPIPYNYGQAYAPKTAVWIAEETHTFSPQLVNQFKYGFARYNSTATNADQTPAFAASKLGITGLPAGQAAESFPITTFAGTDAPTGWAGYTANAGISNSYTLLDNVLWVLGKHSLTFGVEFAWFQYNYNVDTTGTSPLTLATAVTETSGFAAGGATLTPGTGVSYASFLVGQIDKASLTQNTVPETGARFRPISPSIQDNWKVSSKLTLDLGLRYDYYPTYTEAHNVLAFFNPTLTNPVTGSPGAVQYAGSGVNTCNCSTNVNNYFKNFGPRIGLAFQSDPKTVWRSSFGVMYTHGNGVGGSAISRTGTGTLGFSAGPSFASNTSTYLSTAPLPAFPSYTPAAGVASGNAYGTGYTTTAGYTGSPQSVGYGDPYYGGRAPQYINYTFGMQHQWTENLTTTISYVGSQGHFLITDGGNARGYWSDQLDPKYLSLGSCLGTAVNKLTAACTASLAAMSATIPSWFNTSQTLATALKPFPQYGVSDSYGNVANSNYNALQVSAVKRAAHGTTFMANYTWSRTIDDGGTFRTGYDIPASVSNTGKSWKADSIERGVSTSNQPHHFVFTGVENLPFGSGKLGGQYAWTRALFGGFKFSEILQMFSGSPLAITASSGQTNQAVATVEPMLNPSFSGSARVGGRWGHGSTYGNLLSYITPSTNTGSSGCAPSGPFVAPVTACLNTPFAPAYTFGNAPRTAAYGLTGPGGFGLDISLRRSFNLHLGESSRLSLQADLYNVTNYVFFSGIGTSLGSSSFGTVSSQANNARAGQLSGRIEF
jgi:Carboxypeptidase regulatory-like domain/TonB-dependent Receptor Plug Domain